MDEKCVQHHVPAADVYSAQKERGEEKKSTNILFLLL